MSSSSSSDDTRVEYSNQSFENTVKAAGGGTPVQMPFLARELLALTANAGLNVPTPLGLPVYSASGFDLLSILVRVTTRPHPQIELGPVDLTCAFVVVDVRRYDRPIVYASPSFCELTGYAEQEVLGRNCRFLQSPNGNVRRGEQRQFVAQETVKYLYKSIIADKECQASIINYRKNGQAFVNLVTVIPVHGGVHNRPEEADEVVYQVGFQVDLTEQPNTILQKLRDGSYIINYGAEASIPPIPQRDRKLISPSLNAVSKDLRSLLADPSFLQSIPLTKTTTACSSTEKSDGSSDNNQILNLILLESSPDFIHVLSLKGSFLYVAPSVRRVLGFEPDELVGKSISDYCHPADLVPLMRELKESSVTPGTGNDGQGPPSVQTGPGPPKTVDLLFRAKSKSNRYLWLECRGRLHVEPGKGRKAIILSGRARNMPNMEWNAIARAGGLMPTVRNHKSTRGDGSPKDMEREFWGMVTAQGTFLVVGAAIRDVLGWSAGDVIGKALSSFVVGDGNEKQVLEDLLARIRERDDPTRVVCEMCDKEGRKLPVQVVLYRGREEVSSSPIICQIKVGDSSPAPISQNFVHLHHANVFEELEASCGSSWQYELQQLKFANRRLLEEIEGLESSLLLHDQQPVQSITTSFPTTHTNSSRHLSQDWASYHIPEPLRPSKRTWDSHAGPSS